MKFFERKEMAWQYWLISKQTAMFVVCRLSNIDGWVFWCPLVSVFYVQKDPLVIWFPASR